jgi:hypothetical protein
VVTTATLALTGTDGTSGVAYTLYRIEGGTWHTYTAPVAITAGVPTTVRYHSVDVAGNVEATQIITVPGTADTTPPHTTASISPPAVNGWHRSQATVTLTPVDARSGVDYTRYQVNGGAWQTYTAPISVTAQGTTTMAYYSVDLLGNVEGVQTATVRLDSVPPSTVAQVVTETATVVLTGTDGTSGVAQTLYQIDAGGWRTYAAPISVARGVTTTVHYYSVDVAGNTEAEQVLTLFLDRPVVDHRVYLPLVVRKR